MPYSHIMPKVRKDFITSAEAARRLGCDVRTVHRKIERGEIRGQKMYDGLRAPYLVDPASLPAARSAA